MRISSNASRKILLNITNMNDRVSDTTNSKTRSDDNEVADSKGVKTDTTPRATSPMVLNSTTAKATTTTIDALSTSDGTNCSRRPGNAATRKDCLRSTHGCIGKFIRGGGGGGSSGGIQRAKDQRSLERVADRAAKKRKTRRGKPKHRKLKAFVKQQTAVYYQQSRRRCRAPGGGLTKAASQPPAPYNTTQFLMDDHSDLPDLDRKLADAITTCDVPPSSFQKPLAPSRTRDSSFSIDSEEDYFYSSPENEEEFLTKEFSSAYEDLHVERLGSLTKSELIQEYVQLEAKFDLLTKRLRSKTTQQQQQQQQLDEKETEIKTACTDASAASCDPDIAKKLRNCQQRMDELLQQNEQLRRDNEALRDKNRARSPVTSVDSESDSDSSSSDATSVDDSPANLSVDDNRSTCDCMTASDNETINVNDSNRRGKEKILGRGKRRRSHDSESDSDDVSVDINDRDWNDDIIANGNSTLREEDGGGLPT